MQEIKAYKTEDGKVFEHKEEAIKYKDGQYKLERMTDFCNNYGFILAEIKEIAEILIENKDEVINILNS